jgi:hypothetical protein
MQALMTSSVIVSTIVGTVVALKLLLMASRTRQFPELAVGIALLCYATVAQTCLFATHALGADAPFALRMTLLGLRLIAYYITLVGLAVFTWQVFDASSTWRKALVLGLATTGVVTMGLSYWAIWHQSSIDGALPLYARFGLSVQFVIAFAWMAIDSLAYQRRMQKRQLLGLADPAVTNRFGVWGIAAAASSLLVAALTVVMIRSHKALLGADDLSSAIVSAAGIVNTLGWWLTFMPPVAYTKWIRARAGLEATEPGNG